MIRQRRGQGIDLTLEQVATERARVRVATELRTAGSTAAVDILWSPEETVALVAFLAGKAVKR